MYHELLKGDKWVQIKIKGYIQIVSTRSNTKCIIFPFKDANYQHLQILKKSTIHKMPAEITDCISFSAIMWASATILAAIPHVMYN